MLRTGHEIQYTKVKPNQRLCSDAHSFALRSKAWGPVSFVVPAVDSEVSRGQENPMKINRSNRSWPTKCAQVVAALGLLASACLGEGPKSVRESQPTIVTYPAPLNAAISKDYILTVGTRRVAVESFEDVCYAHFGCAGRVEVTVGVATPITKWTISPKRHRIRAHVDGGRLRFVLAEPRQLVVRVNDFSRLFIFADPLESNAPKLVQESVRSIAAAGVDNTGRSAQTGQIQAAIDALPQGGVLFFGPGVYLTGGLQLKSDMTLYLAGGAVLKGTSDPKDYPAHKNDGKKSTHRMVLIDRAENVTIRGRGVIDGNGTALRRGNDHRGRVLQIRNSRNILVEGVILRDPPSWNTHILGCEHVTIRNVKLLNNPDVKNTDGFDPDASCHVRIDRCFAYCGDDAVAIKSAGYDGISRDVRDVVVRGCVFLTKKSALKVGTETRAAVIEDITFEGNDVLLCDRGMTLYCYDGATCENIRFVNNHFEEPHRDIKQRLIDFAIRERAGKGRIRNVLIRNCRAEQHWPQKSTLCGLDSDHDISGVHFENFVVAGKVCLNAADAKVMIQRHATDVSFSE